MKSLESLIVVLGSPNDQEGNILEIGRSRLEKSLEVLQDNPDSAVIVTGGFGEHFNTTTKPHCHYAKEYLRQKLLNSSALDNLLSEEILSSNTIEDASLLIPLVKEHNITKMMVVTSDFHLQRAKFIFNQFYPDVSLSFYASNSQDFKSADELYTLRQHEALSLDRMIDNGLPGVDYEALLRSKKIALITGGSGFLGRAFSRYLISEGYMVRTLDTCAPQNRKCIQHFQGDIRNISDVRAAVKGTNLVFHLAGLLGTTELINRTIDAVNVNILGTLNILESCREFGVEKLFFPTKPNTWLNTYSITKECGEKFVQMYSEQFGLNVKILRWLNAYGPGQHTHPIRKAVPVMIMQALHGRDIEIWGTGEQPVDLIFTEDLARISVEYTLLEKPDPTIRDTGLSTRMTVNEMAEFIKQLTRSTSKIVHLPMRPGEKQEIPVEMLAPEPASSVLHIQKEAMTDLHTGMKHTIDYYRGIGKEKRLEALKYFEEHPYSSQHESTIKSMQRPSLFSGDDTATRPSKPAGLLID